MNLFEFLLIGHLAGDFLFQTNWMATKKTKNFAVLFLHGAVYTFFIGLAAALAGKYSPTALLLVFVSHILLDNRKFVYFWVNRVTKSGSIEWLATVVDQCWHLIILSIVAYFL